MMNKKTKHGLALLAGFASAAALGGCTMGPDFKSPGWASPQSWFSGPKEPVKPAESVTVAEPITADWWTVFGDPELTKLEKRVAAENLDVKTAGIRLAESRAQLGVAKASQMPVLNGNASYIRQQPSNNGIFLNIPSAAGANGAAGNTTGGIQSAGIAPFDIWQGAGR